MAALEQLNNDIVACTKCDRLAEYIRDVGRKKRRMYMEWDYWAQPIPSFGTSGARLLLLGLAPAAHGGNRTGRAFTGDRSGDWVYGTLHKFGFANQPTSVHKGDGLEVRDVLISAAARCAPPANKPTRTELETCRPYLVRELRLLADLRVIVALGKIAFDAFLAAALDAGIEIPRPRPKFGHGSLHQLPNGLVLLGSYHPSQQNTQTGRLTRPMFEDIFAKVREILDGA